MNFLGTNGLNLLDKLIGMLGGKEELLIFELFIEGLGNICLCICALNKVCKLGDVGNAIVGEPGDEHWAVVVPYACITY